MAATEDMSSVPTYRSRAIVRDLQALAGRRGLAICGRHRLEDFPALSDDLALRRELDDADRVRDYEEGDEPGRYYR